MAMSFHPISSPFGEVVIITNADRLIRIDFQQGLRRQEVGEFPQLLPKSLWSLAEQLSAYFSAERVNFSLPPLLLGTDFQRRVWQKLTEISYGETCSYSQLAADLGQPRAVRAVASANAANPWSVIIPCHRVIGKDRKLRGYAGGLEIKAGLLAMERETIKSVQT